MLVPARRPAALGTWPGCPRHRSRPLPPPLAAPPPPPPLLLPAAGRLTRDFKVVLIEDLVRSGNALWFDKSQRAALVLWRTVPEWAAAIHGWARAQGFEDSVVTVEEMQVGWGVRTGLGGGEGSGLLCFFALGSLLPLCYVLHTQPHTAACLPCHTQEGVYVAGTELEGLHREVIVRAVRHLEAQVGGPLLLAGLQAAHAAHAGSRVLVRIAASAWPGRLPRR